MIFDQILIFHGYLLCVFWSTVQYPHWVSGNGCLKSCELSPPWKRTALTWSPWLHCKMINHLQRVSKICVSCCLEMNSFPDFVFHWSIFLWSCSPLIQSPCYCVHIPGLLLTHLFCNPCLPAPTPCHTSPWNSPQTWACFYHLHLVSPFQYAVHSSLSHFLNNQSSSIFHFYKKFPFWMQLFQLLLIVTEISLLTKRKKEWKSHTTFKAMGYCVGILNLL